MKGLGGLIAVGLLVYGALVLWQAQETTSPAPTTYQPPARARASVEIKACRDECEQTAIVRGESKDDVGLRACRARCEGREFVSPTRSYQPIRSVSRAPSVH
jgi:hypothetical protein